jgi:hypothetical protein
MTIAEVKAAFPWAPLVSLASETLRLARLRTHLSERMRDPAWQAKLRAQAAKLNRAGLEEKLRRGRLSRDSRMQHSTPTERSALSSKGRQAALKKYPDLSARGGKIGGAYWRTPEGRARASAKFKRAWDSGAMDAAAEKNRGHALSGRIPALFSKAKPTAAERAFLAFAQAHSLPLTYTGDGRLRVPTPGTLRHWRNPDFISTLNPQRAVLLDRSAPLRALEVEEMEAYRAAGYTVMRVRFSRMGRPQTLRDLRAFLSSP